LTATELKEEYRNGKTIQVLQKLTGNWADVTHGKPDFDPLYEWRIKPENNTILNMTSEEQTLYLTGHNRTRYKTLLKPLKELRISDMKVNAKAIREEAGLLHHSSKQYKSLVANHDKITEAIIFWEEL